MARVATRLQFAGRDIIVQIVARRGEQGRRGGMLVDEALLVLAILATAVMIFRMVAREGVFGWQMQNFVFQSRHPKAVVALALLFWTVWACTADM